MYRIKKGVMLVTHFVFRDKSKVYVMAVKQLLKLPADDTVHLTFHVKMLRKGVVIRSRIGIASMNEEYSFSRLLHFRSIIIIFIIVVSVV